MEPIKKHGASGKKQDKKKNEPKKQNITCKFGVSCCNYWCPYKHADDNGKELTKKDFMLCPFFLKGKCRRGNACEFKHVNSNNKKSAPSKTPLKTTQKIDKTESNSTINTIEKKEATHDDTHIVPTPVETLPTNILPRSNETATTIHKEEIKLEIEQVPVKEEKHTQNTISVAEKHSKKENTNEVNAIKEEESIKMEDTNTEKTQEKETIIEETNKEVKKEDAPMEKDMKEDIPMEKDTKEEVKEETRKEDTIKEETTEPNNATIKECKQNDIHDSIMKENTPEEKQDHIVKEEKQKCIENTQHTDEHISSTQIAPNAEEVIDIQERIRREDVKAFINDTLQQIINNTISNIQSQIKTAEHTAHEQLTAMNDTNTVIIQKNKEEATKNNEETKNECKIIGKRGSINEEVDTRAAKKIKTDDDDKKQPIDIERKPDDQKKTDAPNKSAPKPEGSRNRVVISTFLNDFEILLASALKQCKEIGKVDEQEENDTVVDSFDDAYEYYSKYFDEKVQKALKLEEQTK